MDLIRQLKQGMNTGTVLFGQRQAMSACSKGDARMILVAANSRAASLIPATFKKSRFAQLTYRTPTWRLVTLTTLTGSTRASPAPISKTPDLTPWICVPWILQGFESHDFKLRC